MVHCGACIYYFAMFSFFPSSLHIQFIQRLVPQFQTDSHTSVAFWCSSILSSLGETKNASLPVSFLSLARASVVADEVFHYDDRRKNELNMRNKLVHFATNLLVLSSRLFAAALVTASYNTGLWVFFIFAFHYIPILKCDLVSLHVSGKDREGGIYLKSLVYVLLFHWPIQDQTIIHPRFIMLQSRRDYYTSDLSFFTDEMKCQNIDIPLSWD